VVEVDFVEDSEDEVVVDGVVAKEAEAADVVAVEVVDAAVVVAVERIPIRNGFP